MSRNDNTVHEITDAPKSKRFDRKKIAKYSGLALLGAAGAFVLFKATKSCDCDGTCDHESETSTEDTNN